jgi:AbrB family looped-hinge helix DNA binding protein
MGMSRATVGKRYQVVIPLKEREKLEIRPNTKVEVVAEGDRLIIYPLSPSRLKGIGRAIADGTDATDYVARLRREWEKRRCEG